MDWSIQDIARIAGTTSRTLRHYDAIGLLKPSRVGGNGYRYYDRDSLVRLQRILLLRELGLGLEAVGRVLDDRTDAVPALRDHLAWLQAERERLARQIASVESTIHAVEEGAEIVAEQMFDGFDHTQYKDEVEQRWGKDAYAASDRWWRSKTAEERADWQARQARLAADWQATASSGVEPGSDEAQALAKRHAEWLADIPGTPGYGTGAPTAAYLTGLGEMYVADERFAATYGGADNATFVRDALRLYATTHLA
ncbi:MerR family transcriptional regulator [Leifsonia sp. 21MFCrub1.1]|uniref:MerR family transcriptional regulator n=1 Tax=Leifsonia sp. 21MFCrub1.1 TaxID=1798223 RepID=UPI000892999E|nr:MerR family transcriptional regulator [Leifsonia sp. 21MFCrub1.1]SEA46486.1 DNA-binding transcriptional regulator, MerR family [Leifsonia sp. 21MFCrub1.1]